MSNYFKFKSHFKSESFSVSSLTLRLLFLTFLIGSFSCTHLPISNSETPQSKYDSFKQVKISDNLFMHLPQQTAFELRFKFQPNAIDKIKYSSSSITETFEANSLTSTHEESVEFTVLNEYLKNLGNGKYITRQSIASKDGTIDLHEYALPEIGEDLVTTLDSLGNIIKAGAYPKDSIYYIPTIVFPKEAVKPGDTWSSEFKWLTDQNIPLVLKLLSIHKGYVRCGQQDLCADIELSAEVQMPTPIGATSFASLWKGRLLFAISRGSIVWSILESHEAWNHDETHREVRSCLESLIVDPKEYNIWSIEKPKCSVLNP